MTMENNRPAPQNPNPGGDTLLIEIGEDIIAEAMAAMDEANEAANVLLNTNSTEARAAYKKATHKAAQAMSLALVESATIAHRKFSGGDHEGAHHAWERTASILRKTRKQAEYARSA